MPLRRVRALRRPGSIAAVLLSLGFVVYAASLLLRQPGTTIGWLDNGLANAVQVGSALLCLGTGWRRRQPPWIAAGFGLALWTSGDLYWQVALANLDPIPYPSLADALYLGMYPAAYVAVVLLLRTRLVHFQASMWLDGAIGALGCAALVAALAFGTIVSSTDGSVAVVATNLAYPIGDLLLLSLVVGALGLLGLRPGPRWWLLGAGFALFAVADTIYLWQVARDSYVMGTVLDAGWTGAILLIALACRARESKAPSEREMRGWTVLVVPAVFALSSLGVLTYDSGDKVPRPAVYLGMATVLVGIARVVLTFREVQSLAESRHQARSDDLTGLTNRRGFYERASTMLERSAAAKEPTRFAMMLIDLDRFKEVNDSLGHLAGDRLLVHIGRRLAETLRNEGDVLARLGGDEFAVLLEGADAESALATTVRLKAAMAAPVELDGVRLQIDGSFGIALHPAHGNEVHVLLQRADIAMYQAKGGDEARAAVVYSVDEDVRSRDRLQTIDELRTALAENQLVLHYQPKVDLPTGHVRGVEALVRWQHPTRGLLYPDSFIGLVEEAGLMRRLTVAVLNVALDQAVRWQERGLELSVAVNLSAASVVDADLPDEVAVQLALRALPPSALALEITEDFLLGDRLRARDVLAGLRRLGVRVGIDDYGTGYSSLAYLRELPVDELKLDRSFIFPMTDDVRAAAIVASTVQLAHSLGLRMVAEGVEDARAAAELRAMGCDEAQGYYFSRPVPAVALEAWLAERLAAGGADGTDTADTADVPAPRGESAAGAGVPVQKGAAQTG